MKRFLERFLRDSGGATIIEVAILLPTLLTMMIGVFQVGLYLQAQNAVRGIASEMSRYMTVESQKNNTLSNDQIRTKALALAISAPYLLKSDNLDIEVSNEATQSMDRVSKVNLDMTYDVPNLLGFADLDILTLDYTRSVFLPGPELTDPSATSTSTATSGM